MHAGAGRGDPGGQEAVDRLSARGSRERAELARTAARPEEARPGAGAPGFRKALDEVLPGTRHRRRRLRKSANILNKLPKFVQPAMKKELAEFRMSPGRAAAEAATG